jgi:putative addiction module component (TIGR02574 family)
MTKLAEQIQDEALKLSPVDRAELVRSLLHSLDDDVDGSDAEAAWDTELQRRVNAIESGADQGRPAQEVLAEIRARFL